MWISGNPALRQGKPGSGVGLGYSLRMKSRLGHFQVDYAINAFQERTVYFGISNLASWKSQNPEVSDSMLLKVMVLKFIKQWGVMGLLGLWASKEHPLFSWEWWCSIFTQHIKREVADHLEDYVLSCRYSTHPLISGTLEKLKPFPIGLKYFWFFLTEFTMWDWGSHYFFFLRAVVTTKYILYAVGK